MVLLKIILIISGAVVFMVSAAAFGYVKLRMRPGPGLDNFYHEFEENHPDLKRYNKWTGITLGGVAAGTLLLFLALVF